MPWISEDGINHKTMSYQQSCFPCCLQIALHNLGKAAANDQVEDLWNSLAPPGQGLANQAPDMLAIISNLPRTPSFTPTSSKLITPDMLQSGTSVVKALDLVAGFVSGTYKAMIIGVAHASLFYRRALSEYFRINVSPEVAHCSVEQSTSLLVDVAEADDDHSKAIRISSSTNRDFTCAGNFILLL